MQKKKFVYNKIDEYLNNALNVQDIEKRYMDLELLKLILFDKEQLKVFQNIPFVKGIQDITINKQKIDEEEYSDKIDPQLTNSLEKLNQRRNEIDNKLKKYYN